MWHPGGLPRWDRPRIGLVRAPRAAARASVASLVRRLRPRGWWPVARPPGRTPKRRGWRHRPEADRPGRRSGPCPDRTTFAKTWTRTSGVPAASTCEAILKRTRTSSCRQGVGPPGGAACRQPSSSSSSKPSPSRQPALLHAGRRRRVAQPRIRSSHRGLRLCHPRAGLRLGTELLLALPVILARPDHQAAGSRVRDRRRVLRLGQEHLLACRGKGLEPANGEARTPSARMRRVLAAAAPGGEGDRVRV